MNELDAIGWAIRLAKRLEALHQLGVAHGSVSPVCVITAGQDRNARAYLADVQHTSATPAFQSPERILGGDISTADDVWALASTLYMLLTGQSPFAGANDAEVRQRIMAATPPPLAVFDVGDDDLQHIFDRAFARDLSARTSNITAFRRALEEWHPDRGVTNLPPLEDEDSTNDDDDVARTVMVRDASSYMQQNLKIPVTGSGSKPEDEDDDDNVRTVMRSMPQDDIASMIAKATGQGAPVPHPGPSPVTMRGPQTAKGPVAGAPPLPHVSPPAAPPRGAPMPMPKPPGFPAPKAPVPPSSASRLVAAPPSAPRPASAPATAHAPPAAAVIPPDDDDPDDDDNARTVMRAPEQFNIADIIAGVMDNVVPGTNPAGGPFAVPGGAAPTATQPLPPTPFEASPAFPNQRPAGLRGGGTQPMAAVGAPGGPPEPIVPQRVYDIGGPGAPGPGAMPGMAGAGPMPGMAGVPGAAPMPPAPQSVPLPNMPGFSGVGPGGPVVGGLAAPGDLSALEGPPGGLQAPSAPSQPKSGGKGLLILAAIIALLVAAGVTFLVLRTRVG